MCGIVCYFGGAANSLTRLLTAMSAIIYRAPDSTGIGLFGDEQEPVRLRKSLGSVSQLSRALLNAAAYPNQSAKLMDLWISPEKLFSFREHQRQLLEFQDHPFSAYAAVLFGDQKPPAIDELISAEGEMRHLKPGTPGRAEPLPIFFIQSPEDLRTRIRQLTTAYDLPPVVIRALMQHALESCIREEKASAGETGADTGKITEILNTFERIFDEILSGDVFFQDTPYAEPSPDQNPFAEHPEARDLVWQYLKKIPFQIPSDYDRDGVRCTFRILDAALMCRLRMHPEWHTKIQHVLESLWPPARELPNTDWQTLYQAEKGANVYGWGAASLMTYLRKTEILPLFGQMPGQDGRASELRDGDSDPICLRFLSEPVMAHGRWALQSAVTVRNAHPFHDVLRQRCISLNGQFSSSVETETRDFLEQVVGMPFRTENSSEYFSLLWGYYFENLFMEKKRYDEIRLQMDTGLDDYHMGSHSIDFRVYRQLRDKSPEALDELAFLEAVRRMKSDGGQIAVAGISLHSPRRLYVACHNRPAFVVQRVDNDDIMIVSDINAALGLFSQTVIQDCTDQLRNLMDQHQSELRNSDNRSDAETARLLRNQVQAENSLLEPFRVTVFPLEGEEIFVRLETLFEDGQLTRRARIFDFEGNLLPDVEAFSTVLNPLQIRKSLYSSFYETHLNQVPERFHHILRFHIPESEKLPRFDLRERMLARRFGPTFGNLKRILLVGMGSALNMGRIARPVFRHLLPDLDVRVVQPTEVDDIRTMVFPEKDLAVMMSWSSTTADMVEFAKDLRAAGVLMIGVTEKVFADMALICRKSAGVIPVMSGEEVTVSGIKSTLCMLFCLNLLGVWLGEKMRQTAIWEHVEQLRQIPNQLSDLLTDQQAGRFAKHLAEKNTRSHACILIGDTVFLPVCQEGALKLEECSWSSIGRAVDYQDVLSENGLKEKIADDPDGHLVIVSALTCARMDEALELIRLLHTKNVRFSVLAAAHSPHEEDIRRHSQGNCFFLPDAHEAALPFLMTLFFYRFTLEFARARGRKDDEFPRNRAKSVTVGRSRPHVRRSSGGELMALARVNAMLRSAGDAFPCSGESQWELEAVSDEQKQAYRQMRLLGDALSAPDALGHFFPELRDAARGRIAELGRIIFDEIREGGEMLFLPCDPEAETAARNLACQWQRFTECPMHVLRFNEQHFRFHEDAVLFCLGTRAPNPAKIAENLKDLNHPLVWIGPALPSDTAQMFRAYFPSVSDKGIRLYAAICVLFTEAWKSYAPEKGTILSNHFCHAGNHIRTLLGHGELHRYIRMVMQANRKYHTGFYIGPPAGTGRTWVRIFDRVPRPDMAWHSFGACAHGPMATVDNNVSAKYVRLIARDKMISGYGEKKVIHWEDHYLGGMSSDEFLSGTPFPEPPEHLRPRPFFAEGAWYIPALRPDYDTMEDNLIFLDATRNHYFGQALDELSVLGCRYVRIILITQDAFVQMPDKRALFTHPFSHLIRIPSPGAEGEVVPISGFVLPFLMEIMGMAMAGN